MIPLIPDDPQRTASPGEAPLDNLYKGNLREDCDAVRSEYWKHAGQIQESVTAKYLRLTEKEFQSLCAKCNIFGDPLSTNQQLVIKHILASVYQDGIIAALREQTNKEMGK